MSQPGSAGSGPGATSANDLRDKLFQVVRDAGYRRFAEPIRLASGELSRDFIDGKAACADGRSLALACLTMWAIAEERSAHATAVGGLTLGADPFAHGIAVLADVAWFTVRKEPKGRGTDQLVEGHVLRPDDRVLLVDDVVTTGGSIRRACEAVQQTGAEVVLATTLVDRGHRARAFFGDEGIAYEPVFTYRDFGIEPVGDGPRMAARSG